MPLRSYRLHRYVTAFCPHCHARGPAGPAGVGGAVVRVPGGGGGPHLAGARLPDARPGGDAVRREPGDPALPRGVDRPHQGARPRPAGQLRPGPGGLPFRAAGDADAAHLHLARGRHPGLQPALPDVLLGVLPDQAGVVPVARRPGQRRCPAGPGERPAGRRHGLRWGAHGAPGPHHDSQRARGPPRQPDPAEHQRHPDRAGRCSAWSGWPLTGTGSRSTCSTTAGEPRPTAHHRGGDLLRLEGGRRRPAVRRRRSSAR